MKKSIIFIIVILAVVIGIYFLMNREIGKLEKKIVIDKGEANLLAGKTSKYYEFSNDEYNRAINENKIILLYFFADWCPICKAEQKDATLPAFNELEKDNIIGFRIHYNDDLVSEKDEELAKKFGITYQHTKVILKDGKQILKDLNSWTKDKYILELSKY